MIHRQVAIASFVMFAVSPLAWGQGGGGFGGAGAYSGSNSRNGTGEVHWPRTAALDQQAVPSFITIEGTAEMRVPAEEIRVVLAVTSQQPSAPECRESCAQQIAALLERWQQLEIASDDIEEDFIALLPVYEWRRESRDGQEVRLQQLEGYRMQTNVHVRVESEQQAMAAVNAALEENITDIVTFDYWSSQLDHHRQQLRKQALTAAKEKAELLLGEFAAKPPLINIDEQTAVFKPHQLYRTFENVLEESVAWPSGYRDIPQIRAFRPKMTFLGDIDTQADVQAGSLPMRAELTVVSTVRLYYQSPAAPGGQEQQLAAGSSQTSVNANLSNWKLAEKAQLAEKAGVVIELNWDFQWGTGK